MGSHFLWTPRHRAALKRRDFLGRGCGACPEQPALVLYCGKIDTTLCGGYTGAISESASSCTHCNIISRLKVKESLSRPTRKGIDKHGVDRTRVSLIYIIEPFWTVTYPSLALDDLVWHETIYIYYGVMVHSSKQFQLIIRGADACGKRDLFLCLEPAYLMISRNPHPCIAGIFMKLVVINTPAERLHGYGTT